jgi:hypothetical protein
VEGTRIEAREEGWGGVWPAAILVGASCAAAMSAGAWLGARVDHPSLPPLAQWIAEHALWGTVLGAAVTLALRLGSSRNPALLVAARRRWIAVRATPAGVGLAFAFALLALAGSPAALLGPLVGLGVGAAAWFALLRACLAGSRELPRLDPARVAVLVAVLTVPLVAESGPLLDAWRAVLAP